MALSINEIKSGVTILVNDNVYVVVESQHVKPGKGSAFVRARLRNMKNNNIQELTFRGVETIEPAYVDERKLQYQYSAGGMFNFMDQESFEEVAITEERIGDKAKFLKDNLEVMGYFFKGDTLTINLPNFIEFTIIHTEPGIKGDSVSNMTKPATLENGAVITVPLFVKEGDVVRIDTRTGEYVERVKQ